MTKGQLVGYIRVSTEAQNTARQHAAFATLNLDRVFIDKASGKDTDRHQLQAALTHLPCRRYLHHLLNGSLVTLIR